jgi:hypothetical protein
MVFKPNHQTTPRIGKRPMDRDAIAFRVAEGIPARLKQIPNWQERLRSYVYLLVMRHRESLKDGEI